MGPEPDNLAGRSAVEADRPSSLIHAFQQPHGLKEVELRRIVEQPRKAEAVTKAQPVVAVEVLSKPTPTYTDEARRLKIEGEVVLEVDFSAAGTVRVLRVVRGLGHGLDESAAQAAQQIRFKPATSEGRPVDYRTTVQIVFRLA